MKKKQRTATPPDGTLECRRFEVRAETDGEKKFISGYAAKFNKPSEDFGWFREIIKPGAFGRTLREGADVRMLINHDPNLILGRTKASTLQLSEDETGLKFRCDMPDTSYARDLHVSIARGDISQCSFGFITRKQVWVEETDPEDPDEMNITRELHDVDLFDTSAVTYPAYPDTEVHDRALEMRDFFPNGLPKDVLEQLEQKRLSPEAIAALNDQLRRRARARLLAIGLTL